MVYSRTLTYEEKSLKRKRKIRESFNRQMRKTNVSYRLPKRTVDKARLAKRSLSDSTNKYKMGDGHEKIENRVFFLGDETSKRMKYNSKNRNDKKNDYGMVTGDNYDLFCKLYTLMVVSSTLKGCQDYEYSELFKRKKVNCRFENRLKIIFNEFR